MASDTGLPQLAVLFAVVCLDRPASRLLDDWDAVELCPEVNFGPPGYLDYASFRFSDAHQVLQTVTNWCRGRSVQMALKYDDGEFVCTMTRPGIDLIETYASDDACEVMLFAAVELGKLMGSL